MKRYSRLIVLFGGSFCVAVNFWLIWTRHYRLPFFALLCVSYRHTTGHKKAPARNYRSSGDSQQSGASRVITSTIGLDLRCGTCPRTSAHFL